MSPKKFAQNLLQWYEQYGRKDLPWQGTRDPYAIWVSEIMLQQTQVSTVIPYYMRFMQRFPDINSLALAPLDEVLHLWTGLGYYSRARNLQRAAQLLAQEHSALFPQDIEQLKALPGIGTSTAGAILAFAFGQRQAILDGNVKRVLARYHAVGGWPGKREVEQQLWQLAEQHTPKQDIEAYTQAIMDLGATLCRRGRPNCANCPLRHGCRALAQGNPQDYPGRKPRKALPVKHTTMLMIHDQGHILLQQRPPSGIWGGLWGFPECQAEQDIAHWSRQTLGLEIRPDPPWPVVRHSFSHFHLEITPISAQLLRSQPGVMENPQTVWYNLTQPDARGFAAPVKRLIEQLRSET